MIVLTLFVTKDVNIFMIEAKGMIAPRYLANLMSHYLIIKGTMFLNGRSDRLYAEMIVLTGTNYSMQAHYYKNLINNCINNLSYIIKKRKKRDLFSFFRRLSPFYLFLYQLVFLSYLLFLNKNDRIFI